MLWKLDALQSFIRDLHWPEEVFAEHLDHRLKLMAADMIEAAAKRYIIIIGLNVMEYSHQVNANSNATLPVDEY